MAETKSMLHHVLPPNPSSKFYTDLLYKALFLSIFLLLLPLFHSNHTTSWELLQLLFVGIGVSYGLFSKRSNHHKQEPEFNNNNSHSYVTRLLQVSSVFDDDDDDGSEENITGNSKVETWNSQYYRGEPILVVANQTSTTHDDTTTTVEKPLVGSLKNESSVMLAARSNSSSSSSTSGEKSENIVFRSPIPWRSRSQSLSLHPQEKAEEEEDDDSNNPIQSQSPSFGYQSFLSKDQIETQSKMLQDGGGRKNKSAIPPPPPPPPPPHQPVKLSYSYSHRHRQSRLNKKFTRGLTNEDLQNKGTRLKELTITTPSSHTSSSSFRIPKETEYDEYLSHDKEIETFIQRRGSHKKKFMEMETGKDSEDSDEDEQLVQLASKTSTSSNGNMIDYSDNGPDVDKKADEFIAKFREQIRLQRIAQTPLNGTR